MNTKSRTSQNSVFRTIAFTVAVLAILPILPAIGLMHLVAYIEQRKSESNVDLPEFSLSAN